MKFRNEYYFMSNMCPCEIKFIYGGKEYAFKCAESAFQAMKCKNVSDMKKFVNLSGYEAKALGKKVLLKDNWEDIKVNVMNCILKLKFKNAFHRNMLNNVHGEICEDNDWGDNFWGKHLGYGKNMLGKLLMKIRDC